MKTLILILVAISLTAGASASPAADHVEVVDQSILSELRDNAFQLWFDGLQSGDLNALKPLLDKDTYVEYRTLFEQNPHYSQFLREFYSGASFQLMQVFRHQDGYLGEASIHWPDGRFSTMRLLASRPDESGRIVLTPR